MNIASAMGYRFCYVVVTIGEFSYTTEPEKLAPDAEWDAEFDVPILDVITAANGALDPDTLLEIRLYVLRKNRYKLFGMAHQYIGDLFIGPSQVHGVDHAFRFRRRRRIIRRIRGRPRSLTSQEYRENAPHSSTPLVIVNFSLNIPEMPDLSSLDLFTKYNTLMTLYALDSELQTAAMLTDSLYRSDAAADADESESELSDSDNSAVDLPVSSDALSGTPSTSTLAVSGSKQEKKKKKKNRRRRRRRKNHQKPGSSHYNLSTSTHLSGLLFFEVTSVSDLPPLRNATRTGFNVDPFVIASLGKTIFRTSVRSHDLNPIYNQKMVFPVNKHETLYSVHVTVMERDKVSRNHKIADAYLNIDEWIESAPVPDPVTGLYDIVTALFNSEFEFTTQFEGESLQVPLTLTHRSKKKYTNTPVVSVKYRYLPYDALRQILWACLANQQANGKILSYYAFEALLASLHAELPPETVQYAVTKFGTKHGDVYQSYLTIEQTVKSLEFLIKNSEAAAVYGMGSGTEASNVLISVQSCPVCRRPRLNKNSQADILAHLVTCLSEDWRQVDQLVIRQYVTANQAQRKVLTKAIGKVTWGRYSLGANSANIFVQDRETGQIVEEKMGKYVRMGIRLLYRGLNNEMKSRRIKAMLTALTKRQGRKFDNPKSQQYIPRFVEFYRLNMNEVLRPISEFQNFNEFFYRELKPGSRPCDAEGNSKIAVSAADCRLAVFQTLDLATSLWIKGRLFSIKRLLGNTAYAADVKRYVNGSVCIFRLAPQDYHRFHSPVDGVLLEPEIISGEYFTVNPMAVRSSLDIFGENTRVITAIDSKEFGRVLVVCVGAMMVGSTVITAKTGKFLRRTDELGYFKFGGSTLVVLFEENRIRFDHDLVENSRSKLETLVKVGMSIGYSPDNSEFMVNEHHANVEKTQAHVQAGMQNEALETEVGSAIESIDDESSDEEDYFIDDLEVDDQSDIEEELLSDDLIEDDIQFA
ncbi:hypothetical protein CANCADRAFT_29898 [Tortispora caseinolytica NRRL Y-17796]|uniref:Phosphatidylserine decarboxylase proenzyme 2 n=1 Tax=Tortispora caseinolytica NRRL Y-17796 TaxID=767744 RepID=A0A1E4TI96_9ASCO|nr:hypothetical protein CANCADRAFT_29898 [Tortispora caseinolytica NRRL Y-17796]